MRYKLSALVLCSKTFRLIDECSRGRVFGECFRTVRSQINFHISNDVDRSFSAGRVSYVCLFFIFTTLTFFLLSFCLCFTFFLRLKEFDSSEQQKITFFSSKNASLSIFDPLNSNMIVIFVGFCLWKMSVEKLHNLYSFSTLVISNSK